MKYRHGKNYMVSVSLRTRITGFGENYVAGHVVGEADAQRVVGEAVVNMGGEFAGELPAHVIFLEGRRRAARGCFSAPRDMEVRSSTERPPKPRRETEAASAKGIEYFDGCRVLSAPGDRQDYIVAAAVEDTLRPDDADWLYLSTEDAVDRC